MTLKSMRSWDVTICILICHLQLQWINVDKLQAAGCLFIKKDLQEEKESICILSEIQNILTQNWEKSDIWLTKVLKNPILLLANSHYPQIHGLFSLFKKIHFIKITSIKTQEFKPGSILQPRTLVVPNVKLLTVNVLRQKVKLFP